MAVRLVGFLAILCRRDRAALGCGYGVQLAGLQGAGVAYVVVHDADLLRVRQNVREGKLWFASKISVRQSFCSFVGWIRTRVSTFKGLVRKIPVLSNHRYGSVPIGVCTMPRFEVALLLKRLTQHVGQTKFLSCFALRVNKRPPISRCHPSSTSNRVIQRLSTILSHFCVNAVRRGVKL